MKNPINAAVQRRWKIFPLIHRSRFATEQPLLSSATSSIEKIEAWQQQFPDCPWAVATGAASGIFAVEFSRDIGIQNMRRLCDGDFTAMDTLQVRTANKVTMFFQWPNSGLLPCRREQIAEGIIVRQSGRYAELTDEAELANSPFKYFKEMAPVLEAPAWILDLIQQSAAKPYSSEVLPFPPANMRTRLVGMSFSMRGGCWACDFYSMEDNEAHVKKLSFRSSKTILTLAERGGVAMNAENKAWLDNRIQMGAGILLLTLTSQQYEKLLAAETG